MSSRNHNIVTSDDIENINEGKEEDDSKMNLIIKVIMCILVVGVIFYFIYKLLNKKNKYTYTDENGINHDISTNFSEQDLQEVYKELSEIPLEI